ncbi:MAG: hypothetical protein A2Y10_15755 [Planctomycetes bacterium GWF2_41_51]|nr:MAG: hypothetical protein A2Y10_15755 [Planctomycetes bacterium GWF2_41_51]HBG27613.1 hypothetical protein [Phycisphaerales bacterium]
MAKKLVTGLFSTEEIKVLKKMFPNTSTEELAKKLNRKLKSVQARASKLGLKKTAKYLKKMYLSK